MNILSLVLCVVWAMSSGYFWYSPQLFGKPWMKLSGLTEKDMKLSQKQMGKTYGLMALFNLIAAFALQSFFLSANQIGYNLMLVLMLLILFTFIPTFTSNLFNQKPLKLTLINVGYQFVSFLGFAVIISILG